MSRIFVVNIPSADLNVVTNEQGMAFYGGANNTNRTNEKEQCRYLVPILSENAPPSGCI